MQRVPGSSPGRGEEKDGSLTVTLANWCEAVNTTASHWLWALRVVVCVSLAGQGRPCVCVRTCLCLFWPLLLLLVGNMGAVIARLLPCQQCMCVLCGGNWEL